MKEKDFLKWVIAEARRRGWKVAHFTNSMVKTSKGFRWITAAQGDGKGFPDLILVRPPDLLVVEVKAGDNKLTDEQKAWLGLFQRVGALALVWRPEMRDEILRVLE